MNEIIVLPMLFQQDDMKFYIYPVVIKNDNGLTMVDCGYPMFLSKIEEAFIKNNLDISNLKQIIITHSDHDHMGGLNEVIKKYPNIKVFCSQGQAPYVTGKEKSLRLIQAEEVYKNLSGEAKKIQEGFIEVIKSVKTVDKVNILSDGENIPLCQGTKVIETSGHMPGHISLYIGDNKCLISGDALISEGGHLAIASENFVLDKDEEIKSLKKLLSYEIEEVICYHGGIYKSDNIKRDLINIINNGYM